MPLPAPRLSGGERRVAVGAGVRRVRGNAPQTALVEATKGPVGTGASQRTFRPNHAVRSKVYSKAGTDATARLISGPAALPLQRQVEEQVEDGDMRRHAPARGGVQLLAVPGDDRLQRGDPAPRGRSGPRPYRRQPGSAEHAATVKPDAKRLVPVAERSAAQVITTADR